MEQNVFIPTVYSPKVTFRCFACEVKVESDESYNAPDWDNVFCSKNCRDEYNQWLEFETKKREVK